MRMKTTIRLLGVTFTGLVLLLLWRCSPDDKPVSDSVASDGRYIYLNHNDTVKYVGTQVCAQCHSDIATTFAETGMGQSFAPATRQKSKARFDGGFPVIYDKYSDFSYKAFWKNDSLYFMEFRKTGKDTVHKRIEKVDYIVGSGQHTNSHIYNVNGYLHQMPMTFYTQKGHWDLPPGFEDGFNTRFSRKIGLECMSCHNSLPGFEKGSENKFTQVPGGIGCERCHGPGSLHVWEKQHQHLVDTSRFIDYTIVNPGKLSPERQFDVCQRCHLQGNAVLKEGKSFYDFRPGMVLSDHMAVFMPKYEGGENEFIMASHAERLKMSACFIKTNAAYQYDEKDLRPYKNALTCVTCHNPHVSVKNTGKETFNAACNKCHEPSGKNKTCTDTPEHLEAKANNCVSCHMPRSGSTDIPHVTVTDHYIRKIPAVQQQNGKKQTAADDVKKFIGLYAINEKNPAPLVKAKAYLQQCEKFAPKDLFLLDSAKKYLPDNSVENVRKHFILLVQWAYLKTDYEKIAAYVGQLSETEITGKILVSAGWDNEQAWTAYRVGEAFYNLGNTKSALVFYRKSYELAPLVPDFESKYGLALAANGQNAEAAKRFNAVLAAYPKHVPSLTNLGYLYLLNGNDKEAETCYRKALALDPDYEPLLLNQLGLLMFRRQYADAGKLADAILKKYPGNTNVRKLREEIKRLK